MALFYEGEESLFVQAYDTFNTGDELPIRGDVGFYADLWRQHSDERSPVLELACGTGRVTLALAEQGINCIGTDASSGMLALASAKRQRFGREVQTRVTFRQADMTALALPERFHVAIIPFRSFQHLLSPDEQYRALHCIGEQLHPRGYLALHLFDPRLELLSDGAPPFPSRLGRDVARAIDYVAVCTGSRFDHLAQIRYDQWRYSARRSNGELVNEECREMALRWTYRWELHHLLGVSGFDVVSEFSDFDKSPPEYGRELIVVARRR
ncbi:MAG: class I SAM-dependent methyltransferase [Pseudomonadota bacterium]